MLGVLEARAVEALVSAYLTILVAGATGRGKKTPQNDLRRLVLQSTFSATNIGRESGPETAIAHTRVKTRTKPAAPHASLRSSTGRRLHP
jgi:hypothetical protein